MPSPLFMGLPAMLHNLPFLKRACCDGYPVLSDWLMRVTWKTVLTAFVIAVPCCALIFHSWNDPTAPISLRPFWPVRILGESISLTVALIFPVAGGIAACRWAANGQSAKERVGRAFNLFWVVVSLLFLMGLLLGTEVLKAEQSLPKCKTGSE